ncbi:hypothetical protein OSC52_18685 [Clostridium pasteurianum]|uniref:hypothetical protein n=1 Tax=Clostridium pasteurianum TaxID=1501 RepID=UPI002260A4E6|nr:hypothetical protein [Clostridium pasteurianum]UZW13833.1 hypothetical protein OSC52_18685 [Clostridium pasteurianum]
MDKKLEDIIDGVIENKFSHIQEYNFKDMKDLEEHKKLENRCEEIHQILVKHLPEEFHDLLDALDCTRVEIGALESRYYFQKGIITGFTDSTGL